MAANKNKLSDEERESKRILSRVDIDSETVGSSSFARSAEKTRNHFLGKDGNQDDPIEVWGKRIGRVLSVIITISLLLYLYNTFIV